MPELPTTYSVGTATVAAGGTAVTGTGTTWAASGIRDGDILIINGLAARIATVNSNTSLTLSRAWPGSAASNRAYDIMLLDDGVRSLVASNELLQKLTGNGNLTAFGNLNGAANKLPYFTGAGAVGLTDITPAARDLLNDSSVAVMRQTLELVRQANPTDGTAGRLLEVGSFGIGTRVPPSLPNIDAHDLATGVYVTDSNTIGTLPVTGTPTHCVVLVLSPSVNQTTQIFFQANSYGQSFIRKSNSNNGWGPWLNLLGERGSNANGEWIRYPDGTQICTARLTAGTDAFTTWTYPIPFSEPVHSVQFTATQASGTARFAVTGGFGTTTSIAFAMRTSTDTQASVGSQGFVMATGRWF